MGSRIMTPYRPNGRADRGVRASNPGSRAYCAWLSTACPGDRAAHQQLSSYAARRQRPVEPDITLCGPVCTTTIPPTPITVVEALDVGYSRGSYSLLVPTRRVPRPPCEANPPSLIHKKEDSGLTDARAAT
eukprot:scaffold131539_cov33-Tisochrysis_lutea.AAC.2